MIRRYTKWIPVVLVAGVALTAACSDDILNPPTSEVDSLFNKYFSIGNSVTAGFQSGGINKAGQAESYAALLAGQFAVSEFNIPFMNAPGCPPPLVNIITGERLGDPVAPPCALREAPIPEFLHNVGVPGAAVIDALSNLAPTSDPNELTTFLLGGLTQLEWAAVVEPTFVSVALGNNDVLGAALAMDASLATPVADFTTQYTDVMTALTGMGVQGGILLGVFNVTLIPHFNPGQWYLGLALASQLPPTYTVAPSCAPTASGGVGDQVLIPYSYGFAVLADSATRGFAVTLDCANDAQTLTGAELVALGTAVAQYNGVIQAAATSAGWAYLDPNPILQALKDAGEIPLFPDLTDPTGEPFGPWFSLDGIHPNGDAHEAIAEALITVINATYGTTVPTP
jgi:lysophospholipase L1-like esterase